MITFLMKNIFLKFIAIIVFATTPLISAAQTNFVEGTVTDADGEPLIGALVIPSEPKGAGATTDIDGHYRVAVVPDGRITVNYVGCKPQTIDVNSRTTINVTLESNTADLDEVVVIGYGTVKKSDLTGAVSSLKGEALSNTPTAGIENALQGKVAGVLVTSSSGQPGSTADIKIRGIGSFNSSGPLWVIDGVQQSPGVNFNMNDAASIEVLKDASAAAIYGAAAANGVIIVTTKKGVEGQTKVNFNAYFGWQRPTNMIKPLNSGQLKRLRIEDFNGKGGMTEEQMRAYPLEDNQIGYGLDYELTNADYDWDKILFGTGFTQNYDISLSKANDKFNFYTSANYFKEKGTYIDTSFERFAMRINTEVKLFPWMTIGEKAQFTTTTKNPYADSRYLNNFLRTMPFTMPYDETNQPGGYGYFPKHDAQGNEVDVKSVLAGYDGGNPLADELSHKERNKSYNLDGSVFLKIEPIKEFNVLATLSGGFGSGYTNIENYKYKYHTLKKQEYSSMSERLSLSRGWTANVVGNYHQQFGRHEVTAMLGFELSKGWGRNLNADAKNMFGDLYILWLASKADRDITAGYSNNSTASYFGRLNYDFDNRYLFTAVFRRDGSDRFSPKLRWGTFPSFSAAWRISNEAFMKDIHWLNQLKLRASWGKLGNSGIPQFLYTSTYNTYTGNYAYGSGPVQNAVTGVLLDRMPNTNIKWEEIETTDIGIDVAVLNNTLTFTADWYIKTTNDALFNTTLPDMSGLGIKTNATPAYIMNVGKIRNIGCDFEATYRNHAGRDFNYDVAANISFFKNKVLATNEKNEVLISGSVLSGTNISYTQTGLPMGTFFGYDVEGVFQTQDEVNSYNAAAQAKGHNYYQEPGTAPGDLRYRDVNGDGKIDSNDITDIGNPWPDFTYGLTFNCSWRFIDFSISFQGRSGGKIFNEYRRATHTLYLDYNTTEYALDRWTGPGSTNENFRMDMTDPNGNETKPSSWFTESASYLRLKSMQIGFTIPQKWTRKARINRVRIYGGAQNLWTITGYEGFDPEFTGGTNTAWGIDRGYYPQNRTFQCGIQIEL